MGWTKRQFIELAYDEIGLGAENYQLTPSDFENALRRADNMVASWNGRVQRGIGWPLSDNPKDSSVDQETSVPTIYNEAVVLQLAIRIAPAIGRQVMPDTKANASQSFKTMVARLTPPQSRKYPQGLPLGGGNRWRGRIFSPSPTEESETTDNTLERP